MQNSGFLSHTFDTNIIFLITAVDVWQEAMIDAQPHLTPLPQVWILKVYERYALHLQWMIVLKNFIAFGSMPVLT